MKKVLFISSIIIASVITACGGGDEASVEDVIAENNLDNIRTKRAQLMAEQQEMAAQIHLLDEAISALDTTKKLPLVTTFEAKSDTFHHFLELLGRVETKQNIVLYPEFSGTLDKVLVSEGQEVKKGQTLALINDGGMRQQLHQAEIQANLAKTTFERQERLWNQKIGSEMAYLQAKANYEAQAQMVEQLNAQLEKTTIVAPFAGIVDEVISEQGSVVAPGQSPLMRIVSLVDMYIEAEVPENFLTTVQKGKSVEAYFPVLGKKVDTEIRQVGHYINPSNRSFRIEVGVNNKTGMIKPNLTVKLKINDYTNDSAIMIPQSIISENATGDQYAYVVGKSDSNGEAEVKKVIIETGKTQGDLIEILAGITDGNTIIQEGARSVRDGDKVKILN